MRRAASCTLSRPKYTALHARDSDCVLYDAEPSVGSEPERPSNLEIGLTPKASHESPPSTLQVYLRTYLG